MCRDSARMRWASPRPQRTVSRVVPGIGKRRAGVEVLRTHRTGRHHSNVAACGGRRDRYTEAATLSSEWGMSPTAVKEGIWIRRAGSYGSRHSPRPRS
jgi:hypothetical protein